MVSNAYPIYPIDATEGIVLDYALETWLGNVLHASIWRILSSRLQSKLSHTTFDNFLFSKVKLDSLCLLKIPFQTELSSPSR